MKRFFRGVFRFVVAVVVCVLIAAGIWRKFLQTSDAAPVIYGGLAIGCVLGIQVFVKALRETEDAS